MSAKNINLGKTGDSRTRSKSKEQQAAKGLPEKYKFYQDFYKYLLEKGSSIKTAEGHLNRIAHFLKWAESENVTVDTVRNADILHYLQSFKKQVKQRTLYMRVNSIRHYFEYLKQTETISENPTSQIKIKGLKRRILYHILSRQELDSLYEHFEILPEEHPQKNASIGAKQNRIILGLLVFQGLNSEELKRLTEKDLKLREGKIYIAAGRRSNERTLKLESHQILDLMEYSLKIRTEILQQTGKNTESLFISTGASENLHNIMRSLMRKLNNRNPKVTSVKQIRASVITHWLKQHNLREVQYRAGHRYVSSTEAYLINDLDDLQEDITKFHPIG